MTLGDRLQGKVCVITGTAGGIGKAPLASIEARSMMEALLRHLPGLRLVEGQSIDVHPNLSFRGPTSLLVTAS